MASPGSARRRCSVALSVAVAALLAGCVPSSGGVSTVHSAVGDGPLAAQGIRVLAQPPTKGASPEQLVRQFLLACADPDRDFAIAREFLTSGEREHWNPLTTVRIYNGDPGDLALSRSGDALTVTAPTTTATIVQGDYALSGAGPAAALTFRLVKVKGEWRFRGMPNGVLLSSSLLFAFKPVDIYFLEATGHHLVPDRVFLLTPRAGLADAAVAALLRGPSPWLRGAVTTAIPAGSRLRSRPSLNSGTLSVDLITGAGYLDRRAIAAQLLWTVDQLPEVSLVKLRIDGRQYAAGSVTALSANPDALAYNPDVLPSTSPAYYLVPGNGRNLLRSTDGPEWSLSGDGRPLRHPAVSLDRISVAALDCVTGRCRALYIGSLGTAPLVRAPLVVHGELTPPSWDAIGTGAWTVDSGAGASTRVWLVSTTGEPHPVQAPGFAGSRVLALRLSRDGTRVAAIVAQGGTSALVVGVVLRDRNGVRIDRLHPVAPALVGAVDLSWSDAGHLAVLAKADAGQGSVTPYRVRIDGSEAPQPVLGTVPGGQPISIAAAPGRSLLVATARAGRTADIGVSSLESQVWSQLVPIGSDPTYPG